MRDEVLFALLVETARAQGEPLDFARMANDLEREGHTDDARFVRAAWIEAQGPSEAETRRASIRLVTERKRDD